MNTKYDIIEKIIRYTKYLIIVVILFILILFTANLFFKHSNKNNLKEYLLKNGYEEKQENIYTKVITNDDTTTNYIYSIKANKFTKNISTNTDFSSESIDIQYDGDNNITIYYGANDYSSIEYTSSIEQKASYNIKNDKFICTIENRSHDYPNKCNKIKKYAKKFKTEINKILSGAKINRLFETKNSKEW